MSDFFNKLKIFLSGKRIRKLHTGSVIVFEAGKSIPVNISFNSVTFRASPKNTGVVFIGNKNANPTEMMPVSAGDAISLDSGDKWDFIETIYVNTDVSHSIVQYFGIGE